MSQELLSVFLIWSVALTALSIAINSKIPAKMAASFAIAVLVICMAGYTTINSMSGIKTAVAEPTESQNSAELLLKAQEEERKRLEAEANNEKVEEFISEANKLISKGLQTASSINKISIGDLEEMADEEYDRLFNKAKNLKFSANKTASSIGKLQSIGSETDTGLEKMKKASSNLRLAGNKLYAFFNAEDADTELLLQEQYIKFSKAAQNNFYAAKKSF